jgi:hypothetical protein
MGMFDNFADQQFAKDESGRLVFLPRGPRRAGYFVDTTDEQKIKSLVKVYAVAAMIVNLTGSMASIAISQMLTIDERPTSLAHKLKFGLVTYLISASLLYIGPALLLWNVYRGAVDKLSASLTSVDPASLQLARLPWTSRRGAVVVAVIGLLILALGIFVLTGYRR